MQADRVRLLKRRIHIAFVVASLEIDETDSVDHVVCS